MIKLAIFGFVLVIAFYAWWPAYTWLIEPIFVGVVLLWLFVKILSSIPHNVHKKKSSIEDKWDEFDWWQDNQGL